MSYAKELTAVWALVLLLAASFALAEVPEVINYQGRLTDGSGNPVADGPYLIKFKIYGSESGNDSLWSSGFQSVQVDNGLFSYQLGSSVTLPDDLFSGGTVRYLGITIGTDAEISPRARITSMAYSYQTLRADSSGFALDIADNSVTTQKIANLSVTYDKIANGAVGTVKIAPDAVTTDHLQDGTILLEDLGQNGAADGNVIKWNGSLTQWEVAADESGGGGDITAVYPGSGLTGGGETGDVTLSINTAGVTTSMIADNAVTSAKIASGAVTEPDIAGDAVTSAKIALNAVGESEIGTDAVGSDEIAADAVGSSEIAPGAVGTTELDNSSVTTDKLAAQAVTTGKIATDAITSDKIATDAVSGPEILAGAVGNAELAADAVSADKIADNAVGSSEIANDAVGSSEIAINAVGTSEIATDAVRSDEIAADAVRSSEIASGAVDTDEIASMAVNNFKIDAGAVTSDKIWDGTIIDSDINGTANIAVAKISGTAVNLSSNQIITAQKTFDNMVIFGDSTMRVNNTGIRIGDQSVPSAYQLISMERSYDGASSYDGIEIDLRHYGTGTVYGIRSYARDSSGYAFGARTYAYSNSRRYGLYGYADDMGHDTSQSYGVYGIAYDGVTAYGIYGIATGAVTNWAGYFSGNVNITGSCTKAGGSFRIDHPLDPENKYLQHSFVESPDMMNVYNGNVTLDANGEAAIELPEYFEVLNKDFRYQLTAIGGPAPNLHIAERIYENRFIIAGGEPFMEVSWQVTGVRQDKWAEANRVQVEVDKPDHERGLYIHPEAFGYGREMFINYDQEHDMELEMEESGGE